MKNSSRHSNQNNSFHTDRERERDVDGGGFYSGYSHATGSPPTNISSPTSSFYNLQMYSTPSLYATTAPTPMISSHNIQSQQSQNSSFNLYQSVQEVPYHPPLDHRPYPIRSSPSPSMTSTGSSSSGSELNKVHKNGITFVDPFSTPVSTTTNDKYYNQQQYHQRNHSNINSNIRNTTTTTRMINEPVFQPIYATFGTESIFVTCPYCHNTDSTEIEHVIGSEAMIWACIIPFAGFLRKSKWDTRHRCKNCLNVIGTYYP